MHFLLGNVVVKGKGLFKELLAVGAQLLAVFIVPVEVYICSWCGRMAFFEPEDVREKRFRDACEKMTMDELRAIVYDANPDMLRAVARERIEELESIERYKAEQKQKEEERRAKRKKLFSGILGRDEEDDGKPPKNRPPEF